MKIDLADIAGTPGARGRYAVSERVDPTEEFSSVGPVVGLLEVENTGILLLLRGRLHARVRMRCVRCLTEFELPVAVEIEEEFASPETEPGIPTMDRDQPETSAMEDYILDVAELVRQELEVSVPMAPVCDPDCRGICPRCGKNLNEGPCSCPAEPADSRWAKLADLLEQRRGGG